jgi:cysteine synthase A
MKIHASLSELVGNTPLLALGSFSTHAQIVGKLEYLNPGGSGKDRVAKAVLEYATREGGLRPGETILEKCGGNTAVSLSWMAACAGYQLDLVLPDDVAARAGRTCRYLGARVHATPPPQVPARWRELHTTLGDVHVPDQFASPLNAAAHQRSTGPEIWRDTDGRVDAVIAGIGTGGTLTGVSRYLKPQKPECQIVGVEPREAPVFSGGRYRPHGIPGIGIPTRPVLLDESDVDEIILVGSAEAARTTRELARREGVLAGLSSGAVLHAAIEYATRPANFGKLIVIILCDGVGRYVNDALADSASLEPPAAAIAT